MVISSRKEGERRRREVGGGRSRSTAFEKGIVVDIVATLSLLRANIAEIGLRTQIHRWGYGDGS